MVFPPVTSGTAANDADCSASTKPTIANYGAAGSTYQILGLGTTYKTTNTATTLNIKSGNLAAAVCQSGQSVTLPSGATNSCGTCAGLYVGSSSTTYLAGAINAAQNVLNANSVSGVQNVMIVLSDGGAGDGTGGPANNQCVNSVTAAQNAANAGTWIYSVAYQSSPVLSNSTVINGCGRSNQTGLQTNCTCSDTESPVISACQTMKDIASDSTKFYADPMGGNPNSSYQCTSAANPSPTDLVNIFAAIGNHLTYTQLLPLTTN